MPTKKPTATAPIARPNGFSWAMPTARRAPSLTSAPLGVASFGHINGTHYQNHHDFDPYVARVQQGELPVHRALTPNDDERLIREFVLQLKLGHVSRDYFKKKFGVELTERFAAPLQTLKDWGFLTVEGDSILLNREGLLQVDRLLHEFFLPEHKNVRYA